VEVVFGFWAMVLMAAMILTNGTFFSIAVLFAYFATSESRDT
jgi:hypothetical protein